MGFLPAFLSYDRFKAIILDMKPFILSLFILLSFNSTAISFGDDLILNLTKEELRERISQVDAKTWREKIFRLKAEATLTIERLKHDPTYRAGILNQSAIERVADRFEKVHISFNAEGKNTGRCDGKTLAYVINLPTDKFKYSIFACPSLLVQEDAIITQILIHESAHIGFRASECQATAFEILSLHYSNYTNFYKSPYWKNCSSERLFQIIRQRLN